MPTTPFERCGLLQLGPVLKRLRWGGRRLQTALGKPLGDGEDYAESWEVSCHPDGLSVVNGGPFDGQSLQSLVAQFPQAILGDRRRGDEFPLLVKFLDVNDRLSVQVHPDDEQARRFRPGEKGKTEAWVILDAQPGSLLFVGLKPGVDCDRLQRSLEEGTVAECLHSFPVAAGDSVFVPAGTVHAIGEGMLLAEVQQSSNRTFRLFDWGRLDADGRPRPLHIDEALACIDFSRGPVDPVTPVVLSEANPRTERLVCCPYFDMRRHTADSAFSIPSAGSFHVLMALEGNVTVASGEDRVLLPKGQTVLVPACCESVTVFPENGPATLLDAFPGVR
jgi:mannose-6-phosphate isomerase